MVYDRAGLTLLFSMAKEPLATFWAFPVAKGFSPEAPGNLMVHVNPAGLTLLYSMAKEPLATGMAS